MQTAMTKYVFSEFTVTQQRAESSGKGETVLGTTEHRRDWGIPWETPREEPQTAGASGQGEAHRGDRLRRATDEVLVTD